MALRDADHASGKKPDEERPDEASLRYARNEPIEKERPETAAETPPDCGRGGPVMGRCNVPPQHQPLGYAYQRSKRGSHDRTGIGLSSRSAEWVAKRETGKEARVRREYPENPEAPAGAFSLELKKGSEHGPPT